MSNTIVISKGRKGAYGQEYKACFYKGNNKVYELTCFAEDLRYIRSAYTRDFEKATVVKDWIKAKKTAKSKAVKSKKKK